MRHFAKFQATRLETGCDIVTVQKLMGHSDIDTTRQYLNPESPQTQSRQPPLPHAKIEGARRATLRPLDGIGKRCCVTQDVMMPGINERCMLVESGVASSSSLNIRDRFGDLPF
jgi:hypothetical protein